MFASILGSKIHHHSIHESLARAGLSGPLQVVLENERGAERMKLRVADRNSHSEVRLLSAVLTDHQDVEFLHDSGLLDIRMEFQPVADLLRDRKANRITDLR